MGYIGVILGLYWDNGKENGSYCRESALEGEARYEETGAPADSSSERRSALGFMDSGLGFRDVRV